MKIIIELPNEVLRLLSRTVIGDGGWQGLLRKIQQNISGNELLLGVEDVGKIIRYALDYGQGGYEDRLLPIVKEIVILANVILAALNYELIELHTA